ncbi:helix-turn-helix domain-containing protein [Nostoc sp.]|uniref:helix-turn-helix domain-containing protein n=1 Tax=Nostoc sp. TaxID=1180 RepID=UPI003FA58F14
MGLAKRARAILMLASGERFSKTSLYVGMEERHLRKWARRFIEQGIEGLYDGKRPGRPPVFSPSSCIVPSEDRLRAS